MPTVEVKNLENKKVGDIDLSDKVFGGTVNEALLYDSVRNFLAGLRAGTHATKNKKLVAGAGRKLWKQKGTGRARVGSIRSPLWRHGGTVHGPQPRSYEYRLPRKMMLGALRSALSAKLAEQQLTVIDQFNLANHKSKSMREILDRFEAPRAVLIVDSPGNDNLERSTRNLAGVELLSGPELHPYHLLWCKRLLISRPALERLQEALAK